MCYQKATTETIFFNKVNESEARSLLIKRNLGTRGVAFFLPPCAIVPVRLQKRTLRQDLSIPTIHTSQRPLLPKISSIDCTLLSTWLAVSGVTLTLSMATAGQQHSYFYRI